MNRGVTQVTTLLVLGCARRMKKRLDAGMDSFDALIEVQDHVVALAKAHTERVVLEQFASGIAGCEDARYAGLEDSRL